MSEEEEGVCETKRKPFDFLELSDNTSKARYYSKVKLTGGVDKYSFPFFFLQCITQEHKQSA